MKTRYFDFSHSRDEHPEDRRFLLHIHDFYEIYVLVSGDVDYLVEGNIYTLRPGSLMIMRDTESHKTIVNSGSEPYERYVMQVSRASLLTLGFTEEQLAVFTEREAGRRNLYTPAEFPIITPLDCMKKIFCELDWMASDTVIAANLHALLTAVNAAFRRDPDAHRQEKRSVAQDVIEYINENLTGELSLDRISEEFHMSPSQISRSFRRMTDTSVYDYILSKRLLLARARILAGEGAVIASQKSGFWDYSSFYRLYKKRFGISPSESHRQGGEIS